MSRDTYIENERLRPCDECGGPLGPCFVVRTEQLAVIDPERAQQHMGLAMMFGGNEHLANVMGSGAVFKLNEESIDDQFLCQRCAQ